MKYLACLLLTVLLVTSSPALAADPPAAGASGDCAAAVALLKKQKKEMARELRQIKREIAALRQSQEEPGTAEIMGGIGYILGLCGVAFFMAGRKRRSDDAHI